MKTLLFALCLLSTSVWAEPLELFWEDMVPENYIAPESAISHDGSMVQQNLDAPVIMALDGKQVKIPGFVVPLEGEGDTVSEFLLVPYFGACIHVPPPPPNQIVYVKLTTPVAIDNLYDAVWVSGTLSTNGWKGELATVGYTLQGKDVSPFDG